MWPSPTSDAWATASSHIPDDDEREGGTLERWSSLIGIVTAIVGNMLIALALNVQRYAHTRLHKERVRVRQRARSALKRAKNGSQGGGPYGAISGNGQQGNGNDTRNGNSAMMSPRDDDDDDDARGHGETDPLTASYQSGSTSEETEADTDEDKVASTYLKSPYWWLGQILITLGEMGNFLAYGFAPASIVSPLGVVALICNCIIAPAMFHEQFRQRDFWGVVIAVAGVITVVLSANQEETKLDPHAVWDAITTVAFEVYLGVTILLIIILMWASSRYGRRTILIDLGLVGLFGMSSLHREFRRILTRTRRLYGAGHQGRLVDALIYTMEGIYHSGDLRTHPHSLGDCDHADPLREQGAAAFRLDPGHPHPVRHVHSMCDSRQCYSVSRFREDHRQAGRQVYRGLSPHLLWRLSHY